MIRRAFALALIVAWGAWLVPARAQAQNPAGGRRYTVYMITFRGVTDVERGFKEYLAAQGVEVNYIMRDVHKDPKRVPPLVREIKRLHPDLVYTYGTPVTLGIVGSYDKAALTPKKYVLDIPVVFTQVASAVAAKIVKSRTSPNRNVTGVTNVVPARQQMLAIQSYKPFKKIGVLYAGNAKNSQVIVQEVTDLGKELGYTVVARTFNTDANGEPSVHGVRGLVHSLKADGAEWLYLLPDSFLGDALYEVIPAADAERLPTFGSTEQMMQGGALAGIICKYYSLGQLTGYKAEQILVQRKDPRTIPVETLSRFSFQVTLPLAMRFGMTPPIEMFNYAEILTKIGQAPKPKKGA